MRTSKLYPACVVSALLAMSNSLAQQFGTELHSITHEPRYTDRICPPEYPETRSSMETFMETNRLIGRFQEVFPETAPESMADIEVLTDEHDTEACSFFAGHKERLINLQVRLFENSDPYYLHDITFYKGGGFYFVVVDGGLLIEEDPDGSGEQRKYGGYNGIYIHDRLDSRSLDWECMWHMLQPSAPPGKCL